MSIQFGRWNTNGQPVDPNYLDSAATVLGKYPSDSECCRYNGETAIIYKPFDAANEAAVSQQPLAGRTGLILTFAGRVDNRSELLANLGIPLPAPLSDAEIVLAAYEKWQTDCFAKLVGEWSAAIWHSTERELLLVKDFAGTRQLYYCVQPNHVTWSTVLDPLVLLSESRLSISEEYVAGYLASFPATHLTPYTSIHSVPAGAFVRITACATSRTDYSSLQPILCAHRRTDAEFEEQFRTFFRQAVSRRLRSSFPVLAELSGGMDSTAIVCVGDTLLAEGNADAPCLDTLSYFDDQEPNWDERPYFSMVERQRGRSGIHIDCASESSAFQSAPAETFVPLPGMNRAYWDRQRALHPHFASRPYRILLSGIGGDEFLGGVPTPVPELQDHLLQFRWITFARRLLAWSIHRRSPWLALAGEALRDFLPYALRHPLEKPHAPPWLTKQFARRHAATFWRDSPRLHLRGRLPSHQANLHSLDHLRGQLNCLHLDAVCTYHRSFPYLDRDLLAFLFGVPREQLVQPGYRRALMRRALAGIVPAEILGRKRKAYVSRRPLVDLETAFPEIEVLFQNSVLASQGWLDRKVFLEALSGAKHGQLETIVPILALLQMELWLQSSMHFGRGQLPEQKRAASGRPGSAEAHPSMGSAQQNSARMG
jgi:asparagine synthase (glutamine-hydrolysing)